MIFGSRIVAGAALAVALLGGAIGAADQPPVTASGPEPASAGTEDPFADLLKNGAVQMKIGPSCRRITLQLPPGVTAEEIDAAMRR